jgi:hypothetical protein
MKIDQFSNAGRPRIARYNELGDRYALTISEEPEWIEDPLNAGRQMLKIVGQDDHGIYRQFNGRSQMPDAIFDALVEAGVEEIVIGGRLTVEWVESRGNTKIYKATYEPPPDPESGFGPAF